MLQHLGILSDMDTVYEPVVDLDGKTERLSSVPEDLFIHDIGLMSEKTRSIVLSCRKFTDIDASTTKSQVQSKSEPTGAGSA